jgi:hypothetical protein
LQAHSPSIKRLTRDSNKRAKEREKSCSSNSKQSFGLDRETDQIAGLALDKFLRLDIRTF